MNSVDDVEGIGGQLVEALNCVMDANATREKRIDANAFLDNFKNNSPVIAQCGLRLAANCDAPPMVRHFGLLLVEHCIKHQWNVISLDKKVFIKDTILDLLAKRKNDLLHEEYYIKNAFAKNVVEIIKREWPQQWPGMLQEMYTISELGDSQKELVLLVFLRLAEELVSLQTVGGNRRRTIHQELTANLPELFSYFTNCLIRHTEAYCSMKVIHAENEQHLARIHGQLVAATLATLTEYVDWIPVCHLIVNQGVLLRMLCILLSDDHLKFAACECLLAIASRKGNVEDRKPILICFFCDEMMVAMIKVIRLAWRNAAEEQNYNFLKRICLVLVSIGNLFCSCLGNVGGIECPHNFLLYLEVMLEFLQHPSQVLASQSLVFWIVVLRQEQIFKNAAFGEVLEKVVKGCAMKSIKVGLPSRNDSPSCLFSRLDFDSDEDFYFNFARIRTNCTDVLRQATSFAPHLTFGYVSRWLSNQLDKTIETGDDVAKPRDMHSSEYIEWDAVSLCLESVIGKQNYTHVSQRSLVDEGIRLLERVLRHRTQDPFILSSTLSCVSALIVFLPHTPRLLSSILDKIFSAVVFSLPGQTKGTRSRNVKNVRRHACSCLVRICKIYPDLLLPSSAEIYKHVLSLTADPEQLSQMEKCTLIESLILISNQYGDFEKQSLFLKEILMPIGAMFHNLRTQKTLSSVDAFMAYIGLDKPPVEPSSKDVCGINRSQLMGGCNLIVAAIKRSTWPTDVDIARKGGFFRNIPQLEIPVICNPATKFVAPLFESMCLLIRLFMSLFIPEVSARFSPEYAKANEMFCGEKNITIGSMAPSSSPADTFDVPSQEKQPLERMQNFLSVGFEASLHVLGSSGSSFGHEYYYQTDLLKNLTSTVFPLLDFIPDYRLRPFILVFHERICVKPYVMSCPPELYEVAVIPLLVEFCPYMHKRLSEKWAVLDQKDETNNESNFCGTEDNADAQEILEDQLVRLLTREYIDMLVQVLQFKKGYTLADSGGDLMEEDFPSASQSDGLGEMGQLVIRTRSLFPSVLLTLFSALSWNDSTASLRATLICLPAIKQLAVEQMLGESEAHHIFTCVLMGLQRHGQHESNSSVLAVLALHSYEVIRQLYSSISNILLQIPDVTTKRVERFDDMLLSETRSKQQSEKRKKEVFRGLISGVMGKNVGEMFRNEVYIKDLPSVFRPYRNSQTGILDGDIQDAGICKLFQHSPSSNTNTKRDRM